MWAIFTHIQLLLSILKLRLVSIVRVLHILTDFKSQVAKKKSVANRNLFKAKALLYLTREARAVLSVESRAPHVTVSTGWLQPQPCFSL